MHLLFFHKGYTDNAISWLNSIDEEPQDIPNTLLLIYYRIYIGLTEEASELAVKINDSILEKKYNSDEEFKNNYSAFISLYYMLKNNIALSDKFYRISESNNVGHNLTDFSFRK